MTHPLTQQQTEDKMSEYCIAVYIADVVTSQQCDITISRDNYDEWVDGQMNGITHPLTYQQTDRWQTK